MSNEQVSNVGKNVDNYFFRASTEDFKKIPGSPIAYSASKAIGDLFLRGTLANFADTRLGMATAAIFNPVVHIAALKQLIY